MGQTNRSLDLAPVTHNHIHRALPSNLALRASGDFPAGVIGQVEGVALVYEVVDDWGTMFARGCLDQTRAMKVPAGKVGLFIARDDKFHQHGTLTHIGVVREMEDRGDEVIMRADLFDTDSGLEAKRYLEAITRAGAETGISIGAAVRASEWVTEEGYQDRIERFTDIELVENTITPLSSVPGTRVMAVRSGQSPTQAILGGVLSAVAREEADAAYLATFGRVPESAPDTTRQPDGEAKPEGDEPESAPEETDDGLASMEDRMKAVRDLHATTSDRGN